ncbi:hypothetical protein TNCV_3605771 [Trichonephila clavipes]|uniref:Uncharacterized protein n=1 Tax=Trichonephila clavipes TaxID=2585209 RepID=A0A8X6V5D6_TRICX|nr:hypothetical protein TNCV_3605771 [Trichonephila clavipes]
MPRGREVKPKRPRKEEKRRRKKHHKSGRKRPGRWVSKERHRKGRKPPLVEEHAGDSESEERKRKKKWRPIKRPDRPRIPSALPSSEETDERWKKGPERKTSQKKSHGKYSKRPTREESEKRNKLGRRRQHEKSKKRSLHPKPGTSKKGRDVTNTERLKRPRTPPDQHSSEEMPRGREVKPKRPRKEEKRRRKKHHKSGRKRPGRWVSKERHRKGRKPPLVEEHAGDSISEEKKRKKKWRPIKRRDRPRIPSALPSSEETDERWKKGPERKTSQKNHTESIQNDPHGKNQRKGTNLDADDNMKNLRKEASTQSLEQKCQEDVKSNRKDPGRKKKRRRKKHHKSGRKRPGRWVSKERHRKGRKPPLVEEHAGDSESEERKRKKKWRPIKRPDRPRIPSALPSSEETDERWKKGPERKTSQKKSHRKYSKRPTREESEKRNKLGHRRQHEKYKKRSLHPKPGTRKKGRDVTNTERLKRPRASQDQHSSEEMPRGREVKSKRPMMENKRRRKKHHKRGRKRPVRFVSNERHRRGRKPSLVEEHAGDSESEERKRKKSGGRLNVGIDPAYHLH